MFEITALALLVPEWLLSGNHFIYHALNGLAGHSLVFDRLLGLGLSSDLVKAAVISGCFLFAWLSGDEPYITAGRRKILLITLVSSVLVLSTTKTISKMVFLPRPYVTSERSFHMEGDQLVETPRKEFNVPLDEEIDKSYREMTIGDINDNDLRSFPSDHAAFFLCIAAGIWMACRRAGIVAVVWTLSVPLAAKMIFGQHTPLDIAAGAAIGLAVLFSMQWLLSKFGGKLLDPVASWTLKNTALSAALLFIVLFEVASTLDDVRQIGKAGKDIVKHVAGRT
jgi:membrane-associated phospholipid phosphatase